MDVNTLKAFLNNDLKNIYKALEDTHHFEFLNETCIIYQLLSKFKILKTYCLDGENKDNDVIVLNNTQKVCSI